MALRWLKHQGLLRLATSVEPIKEFRSFIFWESMQ